MPPAVSATPTGGPVSTPVRAARRFARSIPQKAAPVNPAEPPFVCLAGDIYSGAVRKLTNS